MQIPFLLELDPWRGKVPGGVGRHNGLLRKLSKRDYFMLELPLYLEVKEVRPAPCFLKTRELIDIMLTLGVSVSE